MSTINPSFQAGGLAERWKIKEGAILGWQDDSGLFKPAIGTFTRNSGNATYVDANGLIQTEYRDNWPRITYSGGRACLMNEEARTNLIDDSQDLDPATTNWTANVNTVVNTDQVSSPISGVLADEIIDSNAGGAGRLALFQTISVSAETQYSASALMKKNGLDWGCFTFDGGTLDKEAFFDLDNGVVGTTNNCNATIEDFGDGWYLCTMTFTTDSGQTSEITKIQPANADNVLTLDFDGTSSIYATRLQLEAGSYASSYIKTEGAAATRAAESIEWTGIANFLGDSEGGIYFEAALFDVSSSGLITIGDGGGNNRHFIGVTSSQGYSQTRVGAAIQAEIVGGSVSNNTFFKMMSRYAVNDFAFYVNGSSAGTDTSGNTFPDNTLNTFEIGEGSGALLARGLYHSIKIYDQAPANSQMETETT